MISVFFISKGALIFGTIFLYCAQAHLSPLPTPPQRLALTLYFYQSFNISMRLFCRREVKCSLKTWPPRNIKLVEHWYIILLSRFIAYDAHIALLPASEGFDRSRWSWISVAQLTSHLLNCALGWFVITMCFVHPILPLQPGRGRN